MDKSVVSATANEPNQYNEQASTRFPSSSSTELCIKCHGRPTRQKRKRTSPEDQVILEAAYQRDSRPDKIARLALSQHVSLGEKEVQIWFQNRRQSSRRKARPLSPCEVAQYPMRHYAYKQSYPQPNSLSVEPIGHEIRQPKHHQYQSLLSASGGQAIANLDNSPAVHGKPPGSSLSAGPSLTWEALALASSTSSTPSCFSSRSKGSVPISDIVNSPSMPISSDAQRRRLKRPTSFVRLAMSSDGNASVVAGHGRSSQPFGTPQAGIFAAESTDNGRRRSNDPRPDYNCLDRMRSRDSRAWEFWCDKSSRVEMEERVLRDPTGSAANAISLVRSRSGRSILGALPAQRNLIPLGQLPTGNRQNDKGNKESRCTAASPKVQRGSNSAGTWIKSTAKSNTEDNITVYISGNESDKENWLPSTGKRNSACFTKNSAIPTKDLVTETALAYPSRPLGSPKLVESGPNAALPVPARQGDLGNESSADDLTCAQRLLSLSYGDWICPTIGATPNSSMSSQHSDASMFRAAALDSKRVSIGIVGAGFAGLRCADVLLSHGCDVTIFEARDRLGGRVAQSDRLGHKVDLGPNWIHGTSSNPIFEIAKETGTYLQHWSDEVMLFDSDGKPISKVESAELMHLLWDDDGLIADAYRYSREHSDSIDPDKSLFDFFVERSQSKYQHLPEEVARQKRETLLKVARTWGAYVGSPVTRQSLKYFWMEECLEGETPFVAETFHKILDAVAKPAARANILLETVVSKFRAHVSNRPSLMTTDGSEYEFDHVVITTPLGWLHRNMHAFEPPLPNHFVEAIGHVGYGTLDKVYITWPEAYWNVSSVQGSHSPGAAKTEEVRVESDRHWPGKMHWLTPMYAMETNHLQWNQEGFSLAALKPTQYAHPTILFYIYGECSRYIGALVANTNSDSERDSKLIEFFRPYFSRLPNYTASNLSCIPSSVLATAWAADEFAGYGSYCNVNVGLRSGKQVFETVRHGVPERHLWFAGEHTAPYASLGTSTGAYVSGESVARRILDANGMAAVP
ncbi:FAD/NAD(P)-binding domain-containing protein [Piedraia hortae CBS 480.64]|uniref:FAD/NAD(P)-binding domain-containing protein n=1 Tax=Piedraia hortae CBS 480.64 TaxID=1314780 RepID=A0A6A7BSP1_9PEZI|nr:FAD/NAD(P)-binding domain-containing protein [Piedraia hortae CBS 480.64]